MDRRGKAARHVGERVWRICRRDGARSPKICQREHLGIAADEGETVKPIRKSGGAVHHRRRWCVRHGGQYIGVPVPRVCEERAEQHALRVVGHVRRVLVEVRVAGGARVRSFAHRGTLDLSQRRRERSNRRISAGGRLAQCFRQYLLDVRPRLHATRAERQHGAITDR